MMSVRVLGPSGAEQIVEADALLTRIDEARSALAFPFSRARIDLVAGVGQKILQRRGAGVTPSITHFAFWIRAAALGQLAAGFLRRLPDKTFARPRGVVFHLPPQNVETVFLYSWVLSYLAGNANVVRLPSELSAEMQHVCCDFLAALHTAGDESQMFIRYASTSPVSTMISARSDARIVWGGDAKVQAFSAVPMRKGGKAIWFGDRFSFAVLEGDAVASLDEDGRVALARRLYNDIFVFDQMACSSPHVCYVVGDEARHRGAVAALLESLAEVARVKGAAPNPSHMIRKMTAAFAAAAGEGVSAVEWRREELTVLFTQGADRVEQRIGGGYLRVGFVSQLADVIGLIRDHDQTVSHFGFAATDIEALAASSDRAGVSRWAPVGSALDFDFIWDGYDIPFELTRLVRVG